MKIIFSVGDVPVFKFGSDDTVQDIFNVVKNLNEKELKKVALELEMDKEEEKEEEPEEQVAESIDDAADSNYGELFKAEILKQTKLEDDQVSVEADSVSIEFDNGDVWHLPYTESDSVSEIDGVVEDLKKKMKKAADVVDGNDDEPIEECSAKISERYEENEDGTYTIWSASDLSDDGTQIPLVTLKRDEEGKLYAEALSDSPFDQESLKLAQGTINTAYKSGKDDNYILTRVDKTLNHADPYMQVELGRQGTGGKMQLQGQSLLAAQAIITLRDDLKNFLSNQPKCTEADIVNKFAELTGVDYYTGEIIDGKLKARVPGITKEYKDPKTGVTKYSDVLEDLDYTGKEQYQQLLTLQGRSIDEFDETYVSPKDNPLIQGLQKMTKGLIEKQNAKHQQSNNYSNRSDVVKEQLKAELQKYVETAKNITEDDIVNKFKELTGVDFWQQEVVDADAYKALCDKLGDKQAAKGCISELDKLTEDLIEKVNLENDPEFYAS